MHSNLPPVAFHFSGRKGVLLFWDLWGEIKKPVFSAEPRRCWQIKVFQVQHDYPVIVVGMSKADAQPKDSYNAVESHLNILFTSTCYWGEKIVFHVVGHSSFVPRHWQSFQRGGSDMLFECICISWLDFCYSEGCYYSLSLFICYWVP